MNGQQFSEEVYTGQSQLLVYFWYRYLLEDKRLMEQVKNAAMAASRPIQFGVKKMINVSIPQYSQFIGKDEFGDMPIWTPDEILEWDRIMDTLPDPPETVEMYEGEVVRPEWLKYPTAVHPLPARYKRENVFQTLLYKQYRRWIDIYLRSMNIDSMTWLPQRFRNQYWSKRQKYDGLQELNHKKILEERGRLVFLALWIQKRLKFKNKLMTAIVRIQCIYRTIIIGDGCLESWENSKNRKNFSKRR